MAWKFHPKDMAVVGALPNLELLKLRCLFIKFMMGKHSKQLTESFFSCMFC